MLISQKGTPKDATRWPWKLTVTHLVPIRLWMWDGMIEKLTELDVEISTLCLPFHVCPTSVGSLTNSLGENGGSWLLQNSQRLKALRQMVIPVTMLLHLVVALPWRIFFFFWIWCRTTILNCSALDLFMWCWAGKSYSQKSKNQDDWKRFADSEVPFVSPTKSVLLSTNLPSVASSFTGCPDQRNAWGRSL